MKTLPLSKMKPFPLLSTTMIQEVFIFRRFHNFLIEFVLTKEATDFLKLINGPIGLVAVAGMYRTGKSYLLNRMLLNRSNGFGVGPTINPCTKVLKLN